MKLANNILLKALGILLLTAAVLKGWQLMKEPVANNNIWSSRWFLILTVEFELALGIWLVSGLFKKAAWLVALSCFGMFSMITLYKAVTGYASCGCFGSVHVNPWITLLVIDLPAVLALSIFRPQLSLRSVLKKQSRKGRLTAESIKTIIDELINPLPPLWRFATAFTIGLTILGVTTPILALNEPATITTSYEVLEPSEWIGKELPILEHIDITDTLRTGTWLILLYHYDCPDCGIAIPMYEQMARDLEGNEDFIQIALIGVPPFGRAPVSENSPCKLGKLNQVKERFVTTPAVALVKDGKVSQAWKEKAPDFDEIMQIYAKI